MLSFTKRLHEGILSGEITCTVRIWHSQRVKLGGCYSFEAGHVKVTGIRQISMNDITPELARRSGFAGLVDLLKIAKHGSGEKVYLVDFVYIDKPKPPDDKPVRRAVRRSSRRL
jgi:hypothetical protein